MNIAIVGAGFGGLSAAYYLAKEGHKVTVFEADKDPGGLAIGFSQPKWDWTLESHYHHWFTNDDFVLDLAKEIGHEVLIVRPKTSTFIKGEIKQLDSPMSLLMFDSLPIIDRIRMGIVVLYLRYTNNWKWLEEITAVEFIKKYMGQTSWDIMWGPLLEGKFDKYYKEISAAWFWARIKKRTSSLAYPKEGFLSFAISLHKAIKKYKGRIYYKTPVTKIEKLGDQILVKTTKGSAKFDKVIVTVNSFLFSKITKGLPKDYAASLLDLKGISAVNLVLSLNKQFLEDGTYWLNINAKHFPFVGVVEHTNFMDKKNYNNEHLLYIGNYLHHDHKFLRSEALELLREFYPFLKTINPKFDQNMVNKAFVFKAHFAQPIIGLNYSKKIPSFETPIKGLYLCNIQQVYPWDRGTNYAVENGKKVAELILKSGKI